MASDSVSADRFTPGAQRLVHAVLPSAHRILEVGCGQGYLGSALKALDRGRQVIGIERKADLAAQAANRLDRVLTLDIEKDSPELEPGGFDCLIYNGVLEQLHDPAAVLRRHRALLREGGQFLCSVANAQHHAALAALLTSDFPCTGPGPLPASHRHFFTYSTLFKLLLDSGYAPDLVDLVPAPAPAEFWKAVQPLLRHLGLHGPRTRRYLDASHFIVRGLPLPYPAEETAALPAKPDAYWPLTFVACVSDEATVQANLLRSPCLASGTPHEVILVRNCKSAAEGLNQGLAQAKNSLVICVHQDVYLPGGWASRFASQCRLAEEQFGQLGVIGVYGALRASEKPTRVGRVVDRDHLLNEPQPLPCRVETLDELLLAVPKHAGLAFDPALGFHLYGTDLCLAARAKGRAVAVVDALCFHHSRTVGLPDAFYVSGAALAGKWSAQLPLVTACVQMDAQGRMRQW